jgi:transposase
LEEHHNQVSGKLVRCLWVVPITRVERKFKKSHGLEALERMFQEAGFNYLDPQRKSVVQAEPKESCGQI